MNIPIFFILCGRPVDVQRQFLKPFRLAIFSRKKYAPQQPAFDADTNSPSGSEGLGQSSAPFRENLSLRIRGALQQPARWLANGLAALGIQSIRIPAIQSWQLKAKIRMTLVILFMVVTLLGALGGYFVQRTSTNAILMMQENYQAINYTTQMSQAVNEMVLAIALENSSTSYRRQQLRRATDNFESYLNLQLKKVADKQEQSLTNQLQRDYQIFRNSLMNMEFGQEVSVNVYMQQRNIQDILQSVHDMNDKMLRKRTEEANRIANQVTIAMLCLGFFFFIFALFAMLYFPHYIADPIQQMTESIRQIARRNYSQRLEVVSSDEIGEMASSFNLMASKLEEYESVNMSKLLSEKKRTETIVSRLNESIIGLDDAKNILFANPPALELAGLSENEVIGRSAEELTLENPVLAGLLKEVLLEGPVKSQTYPAISIDKDGKRQYFNKDVLRVESPQEEDSDAPTSVGFIIILKNVTELKEQDLAKTNFMATLSHELKTPIAAIDMSVNLLEDQRIGALNEEQWELTGTIRQNSTRILKMVNEILDISRIETGKLQLELETIAPSDIVEKALDSVKTFITEKGAAITQHVPNGLPLLYLDLHKITAVLVNLLTNALRYSPAGELIEIGVAAREGEVVFSVKDKGRGISEEEQRKLFQPYRRAKGDTTKGTGLGLAISKEFVEAHNGRIWVESSLGNGSKFCFSLPA